jgi:hypothetical protein
MRKKISSLPGVNNDSLMDAFTLSRFKSFGIIENHIIPLSNAAAQQESASMLKGMLDNFTNKRINIKEQVLDVVKSNPFNMPGIAPAAKKEEKKDE